MSAVDVWACAGGGFKYDADFSAAVGGYPQGALVLQASGESYWISTVDNNTTDPDTGGAGWEPLVSGFVDWAAPGTIGSTTPNTGAFTTLSASTKLTAPTVSSSDDSTNAATTAWCLLGFAISLGASGYIKFPAWMGGFVFQWLTGTTTLTANEAATITESWPTAFPNACLIAFPSVKIDSTVTNNAQGYAAYLQSVTTTGVTAYMDCGADNVGTVNHRMIAWGIGN